MSEVMDAIMTLRREQVNRNEQVIVRWILTGMEGRLEEGPDGVLVVRPCPADEYGKFVIQHVRYNADETPND